MWRGSYLHNIAGLILWRVISRRRQLAESSVPPVASTTIWKVVEATAQTTAINAAAAASLVITFANSTEAAYPTCLNVFPALIVRARVPLAMRYMSHRP